MLCDKYPLHGQFGEKSEDQKTIDILSKVERAPYDNSACKDWKTYKIRCNKK